MLGREELTHELGRDPADPELAVLLGVSPEELRDARQAASGRIALSLDAGRRQRRLRRTQRADRRRRQQHRSRRRHDRGRVNHWDELPRREQQILIMRFWGNSSQEQVAARLGISQMHVSRLQARAWPGSASGSMARSRTALTRGGSCGGCRVALVGSARCLEGMTLQEAVSRLRDAGHADLAGDIERVLVGRDVIPGSWSFQLVESYDDGYWKVFRDVEKHARALLGFSDRHVAEAEMKKHEQALSDGDGPDTR